MLDAAHNLSVDVSNPDVRCRCGSYWAVAQTHPQAERWALANLTRQGYRCYLPLAITRRRDRAVPSLYHHVETPLFTSYVFIHTDAHWSPIRHTRGILRLLMSDGRPSVVADAAISAIQAAEALRRSDPPPNAQWAPGTPCSLATGPLAAHPAVVLSVHRDNARLAVLLFGALREVTAPLGWLVARE